MNNRLMPKALDCRFYGKGAILDAHQRLRLAMIQRLAEGCSGQALDYGCGYGDITYTMSRQFAAIVGVDVSAERIEWACKEFEPVKFEVCRSDNLDYPNESFDTVLSVVVINWVPAPSDYLREIFRLLRPGGSLVLGAAAPPRLRSAFRKLLCQPPPETMGWCESVAGMVRRLEGIGYKVEAVDCFYEPFRLRGLAAKEAIHQIVALPFRASRAVSFAPYYGIRAVKPRCQT